MFEDTPLWMVDDAEKLQRMAERMSSATALGVDTESDSFHHYREKVCLIQFSDLETDYIVDPLAVEDLSPLADLFANPDIVKIFHGADYDVVCLKRDFQFDIHNMFDTMIGSQMLGLPKIGLADLIGRYFGIDVDKQYQRHDWSRRPLQPEHLDYARGDTHYLLALREILTYHLRREDRLGHLEEECEILEARVWEPKPADENAYLRVKQAGTLDDEGKRILRRLYLWRDGAAQRLDRPAFKVLADRLMITIAERKPSSQDALNRLFPRKGKMKDRFGTKLVEAVQLGLEDDFEIPAVSRRSRSTRGPRLSGRAAEKAYGALKLWRNELVASSDRHVPATVASNAVLKAIAQRRPTTIEELAAIRDVRRWQVQDFGETILEVVARDLPASGDDDASDESKPAKRRGRRRRRQKSAS